VAFNPFFLSGRNIVAGPQARSSRLRVGDLMEGASKGPTQNAEAPGKLRVFISYSRDDLDFADQLEAGLKACAFEPTIDRHGISGGEDWKLRLGALIRDAETVVFVLSPASAQSPICQWEVSEAVRLGKRIIPIPCRPLEGAVPPPELASRNYIFFYAEPKSRGSGFGTGLVQLVSALNTDLDWLREHTRYLQRAIEWEAGGRQDIRLLSGSDIVAAKAWAARRPQDAPEPTALHLDFIKASEEAEDVRLSTQRKQLAEMAAAQTEREKALNAAEEANRQRRRFQRRAAWALAGTAVVLTAMLAGALWQSHATAEREAQLFASKAEEALLQGYCDRAMRFAVAGLPPPGSTQFAPWSADTENVLARAAWPCRFQAQLKGHRDFVRSVHFNATGTKFITTSSDRTARLWDTNSDQEILVLSDTEAGGFEDAEFDPTGSYVVTAGWSGNAVIWDLARHREVARLVGHTANIYAAKYSRDGSRVVTASFDQTARVWDAATGHEMARIGHTGLIETADFSPDGTRVLTSSFDGSAKISDAKTGTEIHKLIGHADVLWYASWSPDGKRVVTASSDKTASIWDAVTGQRLFQLVGHESSVHFAAFSPDGSRVLTTSNDNTARLWDASTGASLRILSGHTAEVRAAEFSRDGRLIATGSWDGTARIWDASTGKEVARLMGHDSGLSCVTFSPDGTVLVTADQAGVVRVWLAAETGELVRFIGHEDKILSGSVSPGGLMATTSADGTARIWKLSGAEATRLAGHMGAVYSIQFTNRIDPLAVTAGADKTVRVWNVESGHEVIRLLGHESDVRFAAFDPDAKLIVSAGKDQTVRVWDVAERREIARLIGHEGAVSSALFSRDSRTILTASEDGTARLWDLESGKVAHRFDGHEGPVAFATFSPDETMILTASEDKTARIWNAQDGREILRLTGHSSGVLSANFSANQQYIATASKDGTARLWSAETGRQLAVLLGHLGEVVYAGFSPDVVFLLTASQDRSARVWGVEKFDLPNFKPFTVPGSYATPIRVADNSRRLISQDGTTIVSGTELRDRVCAKVLVGGQSFSKFELEDYILRRRPELRNPCDRVGPLKLEYYKRMLSAYFDWGASGIVPATAAVGLSTH
jgi:WD40 repeat protein